VVDVVTVSVEDLLMVVDDLVGEGEEEEGNGIEKV
jgi:hypothetical protein